MIIRDQLAFLKAQLDKPKKESKKWRATIIGLQGIIGFFAVGALMFLFRPELATQITTMVQFALTAWGGVISIFLGAQGTVEFQTTSAIKQINKTESRDEHITVEQHVINEGDPGAPERRPWSPQPEDQA